MRLLQSEQVLQQVSGGRTHRFLKQVLRGPGAHPVAVVRKRLAGAPTRGAVVLVHGFGQNRCAWHLPQRSFVNHLAERGFDVFNVDLRGHGRSADFGVKNTTGVDPYIREDLPAVIAGAVRLSGFDKVFLMGHSLGGLVCASAGAMNTERVAGVVTLGPPHALGRGHLVLGGALKYGGVGLRWSGLIRGSQSRLPVDLIGKAVHATRVAWDSKLAPLPVRAWKPGSFSGAELRNYLADSFDGASLGTVDDLCALAGTGRLVSRVDGLNYTDVIERSPLPLLVLAGSQDLLANPRAVKPIYERSRSRDKQYVKVPSGHGDMLVGRQAPSTTWPTVTRWMLDRLPRSYGGLEQSGTFSLGETG